MKKDNIKIKYNNDESYIDDIMNIIKGFDSYQFISKELSIIINSIDKDIEYIELNYDDDIYRYLDIYLYGGFYGFNYDNKNYPLLSFYTEKITIDDINTSIRFDNEIVLDLSMIKVKNFEKIE